VRFYGPPAACARCGFVPEHPCQIDIDHINGDRSNNDPANLQALCANCHRFKHVRMTIPPA
jgi:5-methylcytosine-specific restriction endonuclease McrA